MFEDEEAALVAVSTMLIGVALVHDEKKKKKLDLMYRSLARNHNSTLRSLAHKPRNHRNLELCSFVQN